jgi:hypothetical protein
MSVYAGIGVHRKRSQVAVAGERGKVVANRNVPSGVEPILGVIGGLPLGAPAAFGAAFGTGWLAGAAGGLRVCPVPGALVAVQGDRLGPAEERQGRCGDLGAAAPDRTREPPSEPRPATTTQRALPRPPSSATACRQARSSSPAPRRALTLRALTPGPARRHGNRHPRGKPAKQSLTPSPAIPSMSPGQPTTLS